MKETSEHRERKQYYQIKNYEQEQTFRRLVVKSYQILGSEHQIHEADSAENAGFLQKKDDIGNKCRYTDGKCLRQYDIAHGLHAAHAETVGAFGLYWLYGLKTAPEGLCHIASSKECKSGYTADRRRYADAHLRKSVIYKEKLDEQRCVAAELYIDPCNAFQDRYMIILNYCADKADDNGEKYTDKAEPDSQNGCLLI